KGIRDDEDHQSRECERERVIQPVGMVAVERCSTAIARRDTAGRERDPPLEKVALTTGNQSCVRHFRALVGPVTAAPRARRLRRAHLIVFMYWMISARCFPSLTPGNGIRFPGTAFCGSVRKASSDFESQVMPAFFIAGL